MTRAGEALCRDVILGRTDRVCEGCRTAVWAEKAHRVARSHGGAWTPVNVLGLCHACHAWAHSRPVQAEAAGWILPSGTDPAVAPVWLASASLTPGWYLLDGRGAPHQLPSGRPTLPPHYPAGLL